MDIAIAMPKGQRLINLLQSRVNNILKPPELSVTLRAELRMREIKQRVIDDTCILTVLQIKDIPPIMQPRNPTAMHILKETPRLHRHVPQKKLREEFR
jgi:hypothetical protein